MARKPTYEELSRRIKDLEEEMVHLRLEREALRESEERYRILMDESTDSIFSFDSDGRYLYVNGAFAEGVGKPLEQITGKKIWDVFPKDEADKRFGALSEVFRTGKEKVIEVRVPRPDEDRFYITTITPIQDGQGRVHTAICSSKNITERKRIEEKVRNWLSLLEATLESTADGILVADGKGKMVKMNKKFTEMWKLPEEISASGDDDAALNHVLEQLKEPEEFLRKVRELYILHDGSSFDVLEFKDGRLFERYSQPQRIGDQVVGRVWSFRDVTERKRAEDALRESEERYRTILESIVEGYYEVDIGRQLHLLQRFGLRAARLLQG